MSVSNYTSFANYPHYFFCMYVCVNTHIIENSFSAFIPKERLADVGILLDF